MLVQLGAYVRTNYGTGPYLIEEIEGPCTCPSFQRHLAGDERPSRPHFHLTVREMFGAGPSMTGFCSAHETSSSENNRG
jgi:hypothetical protein